MRRIIPHPYHETGGGDDTSKMDCHRCFGLQWCCGYKVYAVQIAKEGCKQLFAQNFSHRVEDVRLCNLNLMRNDVYLIQYQDDGNINLRQCLVGDGYVQIPSAFSPLQC